MTDIDRTEVFRNLHADGLLVLANAWDAGTARLIESLGASAVATTSAGMAWSHGHADGDRLPVQRLLATVEDILDAVRVPLSVDIEGGYTSEPAAVGELVVRLAGMGVAGINLEDGSGTPDLLCAKIDAIKTNCARAGLDVFVNARTDVYLRGLAPPRARVGETLARAGRYRASGADGLFVPGLSEQSEIALVASGAQLPLNVLARAGLPAANELQRSGVRRLSAGSDIAESAYARTAALATAFLRDGLSEPLIAEAMPYSDINALFADR